MNPFLWLLFVLAAAVAASIIAMLFVAVVKSVRELPQRPVRRS